MHASQVYYSSAPKYRQMVTTFVILLIVKRDLIVIFLVAQGHHFLIHLVKSLGIWRLTCTTELGELQIYWLRF